METGGIVIGSIIATIIASVVQEHFGKRKLRKWKTTIPLVSSLIAAILVTGIAQEGSIEWLDWPTVLSAWGISFMAGNQTYVQLIKPKKK